MQEQNKKGEISVAEKRGVNKGKKSEKYDVVIRRLKELLKIIEKRSEKIK